MPREIVIDGRTIGEQAPCYVIAEIGANHQGDLAKARDIIRAAKLAGADAVKFQKRHNRTLYTREAFDRPYENRNSYGATYGLHREALELDRAQFAELTAYAREVGITLFSTAFDIASADFLAQFDPPAYKIASGDLRTLPLIRHVARFGKPVIISTGGATLDDVRRAYELILPINSQLVIMQCTSGYPPEFDQLDLRVIETYRREFPEAIIGLSSHDSGIAMALVGYVLGARVIEKHFTLNRALKGTDQAFSLEPGGMTKLVRDLHRAQVALGDGVKKVYPAEVDPIVKMSKKLVAARALPAGHVLDPADVEMRSPGDGLSAMHYDEVVGRRLNVPLAVEADITLEMLSDQRRAAE
ncbi:MAG: N-acetylneuraminate synthase [Bradyrhizobiaceae bacterium]|nr:MAG: N-acetylneuraminate synthase [Bradyrhizobiaceae bacterium]